MEAMNKYSVFGGSGFVGGYFVDSLPFEDVYLEARDEIVPSCPNVVNFISTVDNYNVQSDPFLDINTNLIHFMKILNSGWNKWGKDLVFNQISTWFVYDGKHIPAHEDDVCEQHGFYSITARAREQLLKSYAETFGFKWRILRLGNVIGIGDKKASKKKNAVQWMIKELTQGRDVKIYDGGVVRDFIDVRDCARAITLVLEQGNLNEIYNVSNGEGHNIHNLINTAHRESGFIADVGTMKTPDFHKKVQTNIMYLDTTKLKSLGYVPHHNIHNTVKELVHQFRFYHE